MFVDSVIKSRTVKLILFELGVIDVFTTEFELIKFDAFTTKFELNMFDEFEFELRTVVVVVKFNSDDD